ncbi:hypothetical protein DFS34DRAFT_617614 [Phlyctochytrium arcticum]|nr:hypothetical protein DFS34DRAFT_617614 [Phlyctochytrium arcticum]
MSVLSAPRSYLSLKLRQYEWTFGLYMMEPWEKAIFNTFVLFFFSMFMYTIYAYVPAGAASLVNRAGYYLSPESA